MITVEEAEALIDRHAPSYPAVSVPLAEAEGAILREDIRADRDLPPYDRVTMDGIAISFQAWDRGVRRFTVEAIQPAGCSALTLANAREGCLQVMTGAVLPVGCDCVIPSEQFDLSESTVTVIDRTEAKPLQHVHRMGTDRHSGDLLLQSGCLLRSPQIAIAASVGLDHVQVGYRPKVAVFSVGDELVDVGRPLEQFQIRPTNAYGLQAALRGSGFQTVNIFHVRDDLETTTSKLREVLAQYEVLILSGGVSKGRFDYVPPALQACGVERIFQNVSLRPGKPLWFGLSRDGKPVFALPGNPVSTLVCFHRFVLPQLLRSMGARPEEPMFAALALEVRVDVPLTFFQPVRVAPKPDGRLLASPQEYHGSGDYASLAESDGFVELPLAKNVFPAGSVVRYHAWRS